MYRRSSGSSRVDCDRSQKEEEKQLWTELVLVCLECHCINSKKVKSLSVSVNHLIAQRDLLFHRCIVYIYSTTAWRVEIKIEEVEEDFYSIPSE